MTESSGPEELEVDDIRGSLQEILGPASPAELEQHRGGGASNETYWLKWGEEEYVLRFGPSDHVREIDYDRLHDIEREYYLLKALDDTEVPVPQVSGYREEKDSPPGHPFYVMHRLNGTIIDGIRNDEPEIYARPGRRKAIGEAYLDGLVKIHDVDLRHHPRLVDRLPTLYAEDVVHRCQKHLERAAIITDERRPLPHRDEIGPWLEEQAPEPDETTLVHGDYKPDNLMLSPTPPARLKGVLDWEMSFFGDPLIDLGWFLSFWNGPEDPEPPLEAPDFFEEGSFMNADGYLTRRELVSRYEEQTNRDYVSDRFYRALGVYRLAVILEGFFANFVKERTDHPLYPLFEEYVPHLFRRAKAISDGKEPL